MEDDISRMEKLPDTLTFQLWKFQVNVILKARQLCDVVIGKVKYEYQKEEERKELLKKYTNAQKLIRTFEKTNLQCRHGCDPDLLSSVIWMRNIFYKR